MVTPTTAPSRTRHECPAYDLSSLMILRVSLPSATPTLCHTATLLLSFMSEMLLKLALSS